MRAGISSENSSSRKSGTVREVAGALDVVKSKSARPPGRPRGALAGPFGLPHTCGGGDLLGNNAADETSRRQPWRTRRRPVRGRVVCPRRSSETAYLMYLKGSEGPPAVP